VDFSESVALTALNATDTGKTITTSHFPLNGQNDLLELPS